MGPEQWGRATSKSNNPALPVVIAPGYFLERVSKVIEALYLALNRLLIKFIMTIYTIASLLSVNFS